MFVTPLCSKPLRLVTPQLPENFLRQRIRIGPTPAAARRELRRLKALSARPHRPGPVPSDRTAVITPFRHSTNKCLYYCAVEPRHVSHCTRRVGPLTSQTSPKRRSTKLDCRGMLCTFGREQGATNRSKVCLAPYNVVVFASTGDQSSE